jgi:hypothetical protein
MLAIAILPALAFASVAFAVPAPTQLEARYTRVTTVSNGLPGGFVVQDGRCVSRPLFRFCASGRSGLADVSPLAAAHSGRQRAHQRRRRAVQGQLEVQRHAQPAGLRPVCTSTLHSARSSDNMLIDSAPPSATTTSIRRRVSSRSSPFLRSKAASGEHSLT